MVSFRLVFFGAPVSAMVHISVNTAGETNLEGEQKLSVDEMQLGEMQQGVVGQEKSLGLSDFTKENWISSHNNFRSQHLACGLSWSNTLANNAQKVAQENANAKRLQHSNSYSNNPRSGENLAMGHNTPLKVVTAYYNEVADCDWSNGCARSINGNAVGHFTAVVWKGSKLLGCGQAETQCDWGPCIYSACHYADSAPNIGGQYVANVARKSNAAPQCGGSNPAPTPPAPTPPAPTPPAPTPPTPTPPAPTPPTPTPPPPTTRCVDEALTGGWAPYKCSGLPLPGFCAHGEVAAKCCACKTLLLEVQQYPRPPAPTPPAPTTIAMDQPESEEPESEDPEEPESEDLEEPESEEPESEEPESEEPEYGKKGKKGYSDGSYDHDQHDGKKGKL